MTRIAVWGASGFVGGALCAAAEARGWTVRRLQRSTAGALEATALSFDSSESRMRDAVAGVEIAYHCAGSPAANNALQHPEAAARFAGACAKAGVARLVYLGTVAVYGPRSSGEIGTGTPLAGSSTYAQSRIETERRLRVALGDDPERLAIVRVPAVVGQGMPGTVIARFARALAWGVFPHPGPLNASFACVGVRRLAHILIRVGTLEPAPAHPVLQFAEHLRWVDIARRICESRGKRILRIRLPALGGRFAVLASTARYTDDAPRLFGNDPELPSTWVDLDAAIKT
ncbi:MAG: NAD-dependent epimerase/dehydratase family protein [Pseudomonadota bacterium]